MRAVELWERHSGSLEGGRVLKGERVQLAGDCSLIASDMQLPEGAPADERLLRLSDEGGMSASVALAALRV